MTILRLAVLALLVICTGSLFAQTFLGHPVTLDAQGKLLPWEQPDGLAYHNFLVRRWNFVKNAPASPPSPSSIPVQRSDFKQYYFYNGFVTGNTNEIAPDGWMNDVGEKIPNWFENARLYYAYSGDLSVMTIVKGMIDHSLTYGTSPAHFAWPKFPYTTTNVGDTVYQGFDSAGRFVLHETHLDHAGDMGLTYFRMWQFYGEQKYLDAALGVADALAVNVRTGNATQSVWPYRVNMQTGQITSEYGANWIGCYALLDELVKGAHGTPTKIAAYTNARDKARAWLLAHPLQTGYWTDGHSDTQINSSTYRSNMSKSNFMLYVLDHPDFDPDWETNLPLYITWTETYFVNRIQGGTNEPSTFYGAQLVGEQDDFNFKMDYQTARHAAELARWYRHSGDEIARDKAYRALNFVTYCSDLNGRATESPFSLFVATWWSDCYGEGPRMFYHAFAGMPEWAPPGQNHILYSYEILTDVSYADPFEVAYSVGTPAGTEHLRLTFVPTSVTLNGVSMSQVFNETSPGWTVRALPGGDYGVIVRRTGSGRVRLLTTEGNYGPTATLTSPANGATLAAPARLLLTATASDPDGTVAKVEFYDGATKLGEDLSAPYSLALLGLPAGDYDFTAVATDNEGTSVSSTRVDFTVSNLVEITLGHTADGNTTDYITDASGAYIHGNRFEATAPFAATGLRARLKALAGAFRMAIYADSSGNPGARLAQSVTLTSVAEGWNEFALTAPVNLAAGQAYWITLWSDTQNAYVYATTGGNVRYAAYPWASGWPDGGLDPLNFTGGSGLTFCLYAYGTLAPNAAPTVNAGSIQSITLPGAATLTGSASDPDGPSPLALLWTQVSGPGHVAFANPAGANTPATFTMQGSYVLRLAAFDGAVTNWSDVTLTAIASTLNYTAWATVKALTGPAAQPTADPDGDSLENLLEYALERDPLKADSAAITTARLEDGTDTLRLAFRRLRDATDITYRVERSTTLQPGSWNEIWNSLGDLYPDSTPSMLEFVEDNQVGIPRVFYRLRITRP